MKSFFFTLMLFQVSFGNAEQDYPQKPISLIHGFGVGEESIPLVQTKII
jgi:hypothetical protein